MVPQAVQRSGREAACKHSTPPDEATKCSATQGAPFVAPLTEWAVADSATESSMTAATRAAAFAGCNRCVACIEASISANRAKSGETPRMA